MASVAARLRAASSDEYLRERRSDILDCRARACCATCSGAGAARCRRSKQPAVIVAHDLGPERGGDAAARAACWRSCSRSAAALARRDRRARPRHPGGRERARRAARACSRRPRARWTASAGTVELNPTEAHGRATARGSSGAARGAAALQADAADQPAVTLDGRRDRAGARTSSCPASAAGAEAGGGRRRAVPHRVLLPEPRRPARARRSSTDAYRGVTERLRAGP